MPEANSTVANASAPVDNAKAAPASPVPQAAKEAVKQFNPADPTSVPHVIHLNTGAKAEPHTDVVIPGRRPAKGAK